MLPIAACISLMTGGCPTEEPANNDETLEGEQFTLAAGETRSATGDITVRSQTTVDIDGDIVADGARSQTIRIEAEGDVFIAGRIIAGGGSAANAANSKRRALFQPNENAGDDLAGGDIIIISKNGNIVLMDTAELTAGDGANGDISINNGAGGRGGDIVLSAPNGTVTIPDVAGALTLGNGGNGADFTLDADTVDRGNGSIGAISDGGRSGFPNIDALEIDGATTTEITLDEDVTGANVGPDAISFDDDATLGETGEKIELVTFENQIDGGIGGNAGDFVIEPGEGSDPIVGASAAEQGFNIDVRGANGGTGWISGGSGQFVRAVGKDGLTPGSPGDVVRAIGGSGGDCGVVGKALSYLLHTVSGCTPGSGGSATAIGGNGADGFGPNGSGGDGGGAFAEAGGAGFAPSYLPGETLRFCGDATAIGGRGGVGGQACDPLVEEVGGPGGDGGAAEAQPPSSGVACNPLAGIAATGGDGNDGGDSPITVGKGGDGGRADAFLTGVADGAQQGRSVRRIDGDSGADGTRCAGNDNGNGNDNSNEPMIELVLDETVQSDGFTLPVTDCTVSNLISFMEFNVSDDTMKIQVEAMGSNPDSRVNVQVEFIGGATGKEVINVCGSDQTNNTTEFEVVPDNTGQWLIAIADRSFVSETYRLKVEVERSGE